MSMPKSMPKSMLANAAVTIIFDIAFNIVFNIVPPRRTLERFHADRKQKPLQHFCVCRIFGRKTGCHFS